MSRYLGTVHVRFTRAGSERPPRHAELDALADALIETPDVVTVRVESVGAPTVYRIDILTGTMAEAAARATAPLGPIEQRLELRSEVVSVALQ